MARRLLETDRLLLRAANLEDVPAIVRFHIQNREFLQPWEPARPSGFFTEPWWRGVVERHEADRSSGRAYRYFLYTKDQESDPIGYLNLNDVILGVYLGCSLGYALAGSAQGRGFMREAVARIVAFAFQDLRLHRVTAAYMPRNQRSGRLLKSLGFRVEGYAYDYIRINDVWEDHILTSLVNPSE